MVDEAVGEVVPPGARTSAAYDASPVAAYSAAAVAVASAATQCIRSRTTGAPAQSTV